MCGVVSVMWHRKGCPLLRPVVSRDETGEIEINMGRIVVFYAAHKRKAKGENCGLNAKSFITGGEPPT